MHSFPSLHKNLVTGKVIAVTFTCGNKEARLKIAHKFQKKTKNKTADP